MCPHVHTCTSVLPHLQTSPLSFSLRLRSLLYCQVNMIKLKPICRDGYIIPHNTTNQVTRWPHPWSQRLLLTWFALTHLDTGGGHAAPCRLEWGIREELHFSQCSCICTVLSGMDALVHHCKPGANVERVSTGKHGAAYHGVYLCTIM